MDHRFDLSELAQSNIVYIRAMAVADLPDEMREQAQGVDRVYAVCRENGEQLALVANRNLAFALARQNDFAPVTVH
ncbi:MAG: hypothetical protein CSA68_06495 [Rhodobacterales bacterium]|nr:MAG: hypothetical protein CSA68_06495 [Rhodobacterales bacterium]